MPVDDKSDASSHPSSSNPTAKKRKLDNGTADGSTPSSKTELDKTMSVRATRTFQEVFVGVGKGGEGARGRLWVCDVSVAFAVNECNGSDVQLCFKYMRSRDGWSRHVVSVTRIIVQGS